jgi:hypothetical protein
MVADVVDAQVRDDSFDVISGLQRQYATLVEGDKNEIKSETLEGLSKFVRLCSMTTRKTTAFQLDKTLSDLWEGSPAFAVASGDLVTAQNIAALYEEWNNVYNKLVTLVERRQQQLFI